MLNAVLIILSLAVLIWAIGAGCTLLVMPQDGTLRARLAYAAMWPVRIIRG